MARNGSGTYTVPNTFSPGDTISSADQNENFDDLGDEITNSVAADGQTSMTGPLKAAAGSAANPSVTFASDQDTGFYRSSANSVGLSLGGALAVEFSTANTVFAVPVSFNATASFAQLGTANFVATASFSSGFIASATAFFAGNIMASATATFSGGFIASATSTFAGEMIASATATFTTRINIAGSQAVTVATQGWTFISAQDASNSATIDFASGLDSTYDEYCVVFSNVKPATDDVALYMRVGTGAGPTYQSGAAAYAAYSYDYRAAGTNDASASQMRLTLAGGSGAGVGNAAGEHISGQVYFANPDGSDFQTFRFSHSYVAADGVVAGGNGIGIYKTAAGAITAIRFLFASGNIASGHFALYGLRRA